MSSPAALFDLSGKIALVTGASRGLGKHFALTLAQAGADVAITSRTLASLDDTQKEIAALGRKVFPVALDVRDHASITTAINAVHAHFGRIDVLVNNAGCNIRKPALDVSWEDWNTILDTNLRGVFFVAQAVGRHMVAAKKGRIINIGSVTCVAGYAGLAPYGASRGGVKQLTMSLAADWGPSGVTVNCLAPGWFKTAQNAVLYDNAEWVSYLSDKIPLRRPGKIDDLTGPLLFLASDASVYVSGQTLLVDGGITVNDTRALPAKK
jgi:NAD(P)-dependent dehydrogenase (short-subunit alcohol dehydrogenase family)